MKKEEIKRKSLNALIEDIASSDDVNVAGITAQSIAQSEQKQETQQAPERAAFSTKKATTIMPKEVFSALQMYCIRTDTPKHRAIYLFLIEGLRNAGQITEGEYIRYREMAAMMTTTYDKKQ